MYAAEELSSDEDIDLVLPSNRYASYSATNEQRDHRQYYISKHFHIKGMLEAVVCIPKNCASSSKQVFFAGSYISNQCDLIANWMAPLISVCVNWLQLTPIPKRPSNDVQPLENLRETFTLHLLDMFIEFANNKAEYQAFYDRYRFHQNIQSGMQQDDKHRTQISELLRYHSNKTGETDMVSLREYIGRMSLHQTAIYYTMVDAVIDSTEWLQTLKRREMEVLYLRNKVDELVLQQLSMYMYDGMKFQCVAKETVDLMDECVDEMYKTPPAQKTANKKRNSNKHKKTKRKSKSKSKSKRKAVGDSWTPSNGVSKVAMMGLECMDKQSSCLVVDECGSNECNADLDGVDTAKSLIDMFLDENMEINAKHVLIPTSTTNKWNDWRCGEISIHLHENQDGKENQAVAARSEYYDSLLIVGFIRDELEFYDDKSVEFENWCQKSVRVIGNSLDAQYSTFNL